MELSVIVNWGFHTDFAEKKGTGHVDVSLGVTDGGVASGGADLSYNTSKSSYGHGLVDNFGGCNCKLSLLISSPGVDKYCTFFFGWFIDENIAVIVIHI